MSWKSVKPDEKHRDGSFAQHGMKTILEMGVENSHTNLNKHTSHKWIDINARVKELRKLYAQLFVKTPSDIDIRQLNENWFRVYFLLSEAQGREASLYYCDIHISKFPPHATIKEVLHPSPTSTLRRTSREEQLLSERRRCSVWGITRYHLHHPSGTIVFPAASTIFHLRHPCEVEGRVKPTEVNNCRVRLDPHICPSSPELIAFTADRDVYVYNTNTGTESRLSRYFSGGAALADAPRSAGTPPYVIQEEFFRYQGCWWQPATVACHRLLYEEVDESSVPIVQFMSHDQCTPDEFRFPRAGSPNAVSSLHIATLSPSGEVLGHRTLQPPLPVLAPWHQYLVRVAWTPCGEFVSCQLMDRSQRRLDLILVPLAMFCPAVISTLTNMPEATEEPPACTAYTLLSEQSPADWVEVHDLLHWFRDDYYCTRNFVWASEETGYRHLYLYTVRLGGRGAVHVASKVALTSGDWVVLNRGLWVDEARRLVYFHATRDSPIEPHLYVCSLDPRPAGDRVVQRLTQPGMSHAATLDPSCRVMVVSSSCLASPGSSVVFRLSPNTCGGSGLVQVTQLTTLLPGPSCPAPSALVTHTVPEVLPVTLGDGTKLYAMVFRPQGLPAGASCPTVLHVYGGPQVQLVTNTFKGVRHMRTHMLTNYGMCVVSIDSRGSDNRGMKFQSHVKHRLGTVEIADQVEALQLLSLRFPCIDLTRLGVFGWSYGGYLALMALAQRGDLFRVAVAGAPVVSWEFYDTGYTERYMDTPARNHQGYKASSVLSHIADFPDDEGRLLIVQGIIDENVHFCHSTALVQHLVNAGKPYRLQVYPRERHCLRQLDSNEHYETALIHFLLKGLTS